MVSYDQAAAKKQWREAVRAVAEAIEDAGGIVNNVNDARLDAGEEWIGESRRWLLDGLRLGSIDVAKANRAMWAADTLLYLIEKVRERIRKTSFRLGLGRKREFVTLRARRPFSPARVLKHLQAIH